MIVSRQLSRTPRLFEGAWNEFLIRKQARGGVVFVNQTHPQPSRANSVRSTGLLILNCPSPVPSRSQKAVGDLSSAGPLGNPPEGRR